MPLRYSFMALCALAALLLLAKLALLSFSLPAMVALLICIALVGLGIHDLRQMRHAILRNYPMIGHMRFLLEYIWPEMRQYFIESDSEATPFFRAQRSLV